MNRDTRASLRSCLHWHEGLLAFFSPGEGIKAVLVHAVHGTELQKHEVQEGRFGGNGTVGFPCLPTWWCITESSSGRVGGSDRIQGFVRPYWMNSGAD